MRVERVISVDQLCDGRRGRAQLDHAFGYEQERHAFVLATQAHAGRVTQVLSTHL